MFGLKKPERFDKVAVNEAAAARKLHEAYETLVGIEGGDASMAAVTGLEVYIAQAANVGYSRERLIELAASAINTYPDAGWEAAQRGDFKKPQQGTTIQ